jgi:hypothetical protein
VGLALFCFAVRLRGRSPVLSIGVTSPFHSLTPVRPSSMSDDACYQQLLPSSCLIVRWPLCWQGRNFGTIVGVEGFFHLCGGKATEQNPAARFACPRGKRSVFQPDKLSLHEDRKSSRSLRNCPAAPDATVRCRRFTILVKIGQQARNVKR